MILLLPPANEVWGKVIFSQACVILFTRGGVGFPACITGHNWEGLHPGRESASRGVCLKGVGQNPPPQLNTVGYGQQAGGTHPTGMHSCSETATVIET